MPAIAPLGASQQRLGEVGIGALVAADAISPCALSLGIAMHASLVEPEVAQQRSALQQCSYAPTRVTRPVHVSRSTALASL